MKRTIPYLLMAMLAMPAMAQVSARAVAPSQITTVSGTGSTLVTGIGPYTQGHCPGFDLLGNLIDTGSPCGGGGTTVSSFNGRTGAVTPAANDYGFSLLSGTATAAQLPATTVYTGQANTYTAGMKQTMAASSTNAGEGFSGVTADPSVLVGGDRWWRSDLHRMRVYDGTTTQSLAYLSDVPITVGFPVSSGTTGTDVGPELLAPHSGTISICKVRVKTSDASTALTFAIKRNGTTVFSSSPTIAAGTAAGTTSTCTSSLSGAPITVARDDVFTIDITSGTSSWAFTAQLE